MIPLSLLPTAMALPVYVAEEIKVGRSVFQNFVHEEFEVEGVPDLLDEVPEEELEEDVADRSGVHHYVDENFANAMNHFETTGFNTHVISRQVGASIRELANEFAQSRERRRLKREADRVDVATITSDGFFALCEEVFRQGITRENLIALFFFCADVLIKCVKSQLKDIGVRLFKWALQFIVDRVCTWVAEHGGWENAIKNTFSKRQLYVISAATIGVFAVSGFLFYKLRS